MNEVKYVDKIEVECYARVFLPVKVLRKNFMSSFCESILMYADHSGEVCS
jgi:hypothetical protein